MGDLVCTVCGKILFEYWKHDIICDSMSNPTQKYAKFGGNCGSCGRLCCGECLKEGACPSCHARLKRLGGSLI